MKKMARRADDSVESTKEYEEDFTVVRCEAAMLERTRQYEKAIKRYTKAVELSDSDKRCLVARSRCYLTLGDTRRALGDAESSLMGDKTFYQGILRKAEALFQKGDFEMALVNFHRGNKLRPDLEDFRLGIQKARDAIENSVGTPNVVKLNTTGDLSYFMEQQQMKPKKQGLLRSFVLRQTAVKQAPPRNFEHSRAENMTIRHMLGVLYRDKNYLEKLLQQTDSSTNFGRTICDLAEEALTYLDSRTDFWRQQKPMCARVYERAMFKKRFSSHDAVTDEIILGHLEKIDEAQAAGRYREALRRAMQCLESLSGYTQLPLDSRVALKGQVNSCMGNAYMELQQHQKALRHFQQDFRISRKYGIMEGVSRAMDNLGRVYVMLGFYNKAIKTWEAKLSMAKTAVETIWLCHEVGRCYLETNRPTEAKYYADHALEEAQAAEDTEWQLHATVLIAQTQVKAQDFNSALSIFERALELATECEDPEAEAAIRKALESVNNRIAKNQDNKAIVHSEVERASKEEGRAKEGVKSRRKNSKKRRNSKGGNEGRRKRKASGKDRRESEGETSGERRGSKMSASDRRGSLGGKSMERTLSVDERQTSSMAESTEDSVNRAHREGSQPGTGDTTHEQTPTVSAEEGVKESQSAHAQEAPRAPAGEEAKDSPAPATEDVPKDIPPSVTEDAPKDVPPPAAEDVPPPATEDVPKDVPPSVTEDVPPPTAEDVPPSAEDDEPKAVPPPATEDVPSAKEDVPPATEEVPATAEDVPPPATEDVPHSEGDPEQGEDTAPQQ